MREFKQTRVSSMEHKFQDLRSSIVGMLDKAISEKSYSAVVRGQNQSLYQRSVSSMGKSASKSFGGFKTRYTRRCYGCEMIGHIISEWWNIK